MLIVQSDTVKHRSFRWITRPCTTIVVIFDRAQVPRVSYMVRDFYKSLVYPSVDLQRAQSEMDVSVQHCRQSCRQRRAAESMEEGERTTDPAGTTKVKTVE